VKEVLAKLTVEAKRAEKLLQILLKRKTWCASRRADFSPASAGSIEEQLSAYKKQRATDFRAPFKEIDGITRSSHPLLE